MIKHFTKSELVFNQLRDMIYSGELKPGEKVSAIEIANQMGVSRTPVNEAVKRLFDRKLVSILPNVGFQITILPWKDILDLMQLKMILEQTAVRWIQQRKITVDVASLKELNNRIITAIKSGTRLEYNECVRKYHLEFIASAGSQPLLDSFTGTWDYSGWEDTRFQELTIDLVNQCKDHNVMLESLKNGDYDKALKVSAAHGEKWIDLFKKNFETYSDLKKIIK